MFNEAARKFYEKFQLGKQQDEEMLVPHSDIVVVAQVDPASTVENQQVEEPPSMKFTWTIYNISRLNTKKHYSEYFYCWWLRILIFPKGNNVDYLSICNFLNIGKEFSVMINPYVSEARKLGSSLQLFQTGETSEAEAFDAAVDSAEVAAEQ
ncbi:hypothetical protein GQ457_15G004090 [Hibiscus cannabinus]